MTQPTDPDQPGRPQDHNPPPPWANEPASPPPWAGQPTPPPWAGQPGGSSSADGSKRRPWVARHKILTGLGAVLAVGIIGSAVGGGADPQPVTNAAATATEDTTEGTALDPNAPPTSAVPPAPEVTADPTTAAPTTKVAPKPKPTPEPPAEPELTAGQKNALGSAKSYLEFSGLSRLGLIEQLSSSYGDGYSKADATYAVDHLGANWNEQAVRSAKSYLENGNFSRSGLIEQLSSPAGDKFTRAQATYAADKVGL